MADDSNEPEFDYEALARALLPEVRESVGYVRLNSLRILINDILPELPYFARIKAQELISEFTAEDFRDLNETETRSTFLRTLEPLHKEAGRVIDPDNFEIYPSTDTTS